MLDNLAASAWSEGAKALPFQGAINGRSIAEQTSALGQ
jgi:hypothetical protein